MKQQELLKQGVFLRQCSMLGTNFEPGCLVQSLCLAALSSRCAWLTYGLRLEFVPQPLHNYTLQFRSEHSSLRILFAQSRTR